MYLKKKTYYQEKIDMFLIKKIFQRRISKVLIAGLIRI